MNEITLDEVLVAAHDIEFAQYDNSPEHSFSHRHIRAMKRIFKIYERNASLLYNVVNKDKKQESHIRWNRKSLAIVLVMILLAVLAGCAVIIYTLGGFKTEAHTDNTELFPIDYESGSEFIENEYYLSDLPKGFKEIGKGRSEYYVYHYFKNDKNGQTATFRQFVKKLYEGHANTELGKLEEIKINEKTGLCVDYTDSNFIGCTIVWDNGDYILEVMTNMPKQETLDLAKSANIAE